MADRREMTIVMTAKDLFTGTMSRFDARINKLRNNWVAAAAKMAAAAFALKKSWDLAFASAQFKQSETAFANLAASHGVNAQEMIADLKKMSAQTISTADIMQSAGTAMLLGIPAEKLAELMEIARASSRITGDSIQKSFKDISKGVGRQSRMILDNLGIIVKVDEANKAFAETMHITGRELTDVEKKQAFLDATLEAGQDTIRRVNVLGRTSAEIMQTIKATAANYAVQLGILTIATVGYITAGLMNLSKWTATGASKTLTLYSKLIRLGEVLPWLGDTFAATADHIEKMGSNQAENAIEAERLRKKAQELSDEILTVADVVEQSSIAWRKNTGEVEANSTALTTSMGVMDEHVRAWKEQMAAKQALADLGAAPGVDTGDTGAPAQFSEFERMQENLALIQEHYAQKIVLISQGDNDIFAIHQALNDAEIASDRQKHQMKLSVAQGTMGMMANMMQNMFVLTGSKNKQMFAMMKAFAIAETTIDTIKSAQSAYASAAKIPAVGFVLAPIAAAAAVVAGMARVKQISSMSPGGATASISAGGTANPSYGGGSPSAYPVPERIERQTETRPSITFIVERMELLDEDSVDRLIARVTDRVKNYDVTLEASTAKGLA